MGLTGVRGLYSVEDLQLSGLWLRDQDATMGSSEAPLGRIAEQVFGLPGHQDHVK